MATIQPSVVATRKGYASANQIAATSTLKKPEVKKWEDIRKAPVVDTIKINNVVVLGSSRTPFTKAVPAGTAIGYQVKQLCSKILPSALNSVIKLGTDWVVNKITQGNPRLHMTSDWEGRYEVNSDAVLKNLIQQKLEELGFNSDKIKKFIAEGGIFEFSLTTHSEMSQNMCGRIRQLLIQEWQLSDMEANLVKIRNQVSGACHSTICERNEVIQKLDVEASPKISIVLGLDNMTVGLNFRREINGEWVRHERLSAQEPLSRFGWAQTDTALQLVPDNGVPPSRGADHEAVELKITTEQVDQEAKLQIARMAYYQHKYGNKVVQLVDEHGNPISTQDAFTELTKLPSVSKPKQFVGYQVLRPSHMTGIGDGAALQMLANQAALDKLTQIQPTLVPKVRIVAVTTDIVSSAGATQLPTIVAGKLEENYSQEHTDAFVANACHAPFAHMGLYDRMEAEITGRPSYLKNISPAAATSIHPIAATVGRYDADVEQALSEKGLEYVVSKNDLPENTDIKSDAEIPGSQGKATIVKPYADFVDEYYKGIIENAAIAYNIESGWSKPAQKYFECEASIAKEIAEKEGKVFDGKPPKTFDLDKMIELVKLKEQRDKETDSQKKETLTNQLHQKFEAPSVPNARTVNDVNTKAFVRLRTLMWGEEQIKLKAETKDMVIIRIKPDAVAEVVSGVDNGDTGLAGGAIYQRYVSPESTS